MADPVEFHGVNKIFTAPEGREDSIRPLPTFINGHAIVSAWKFTDEEWEEISKTRTAFIAIFSGLTLFPMYVGNNEGTRCLVADSGPVWPKGERE
jgi:hypothetical protein